MDRYNRYHRKPSSGGIIKNLAVFGAFCVGLALYAAAILASLAMPILIVIGIVLVIWKFLL